MLSGAVFLLDSCSTLLCLRTIQEVWREVAPGFGSVSGCVLGFFMETQGLGIHTGSIS